MKCKYALHTLRMRDSIMEDQDELIIRKSDSEEVARVGRLL